MNELQEAQKYIRYLINRSSHYVPGVANPIRPTSVNVPSKEYYELLNLPNPFNMDTIKWLEQTCNIIIVKQQSITKIEYTVDEIMDKL